MLMSMMQIRIVRMPMAQPRMMMHVAVRLAAVPAARVLVMVMQVVHMLVRVRERLVHMVVLMALAQVQPHTERH
jgi:hypothetical protein